LKSFAALEDLRAILVKQERKVVKAAMFQAVKPVPRTFFAPKYIISTAPQAEMML
jgi:hypothetical protein